MIKLHEIHKIYTQGTTGFHALKDVSLYFELGETIVIYGKSGCGKTTLLNLLGGIDRPSSGDMVIDQKLTTNFKESEWDYFRNHRIGFIFQQYQLIEHLPVIENVALAAKISGISHNKAKEKALDLLKRVGLEKHAHKHPKELSGGERQRVSIARALVNDPDIILADEPTGALDEKTGKEIMDLIQTIGKDKLVIIVTHNLKLAKQYATRLIELKDGRVIQDSNPLEKRVKISLTREKNTAKLSFKEGIRIALFNLFSRKFRTALVSMALALGIIALMLIDAGFNTVRGSILAPTESLRNNPEIRITAPVGEFVNHEAMINYLNLNYPYFNDFSPIQQPLFILSNDDTATTYDQPIELRTFQSSFTSLGVIDIHNHFIGEGRFPESENEFVITINQARRLFNVNLMLTDTEIWEEIQGNTFTIASRYNYKPVIEPDENSCLFVENWDQDPNSLPATFYTMYDDYDAHNLALDPYRDVPYTFEDEDNQVTIFCTDYDQLSWVIAYQDVRETESLILVGITNRNHINKAYFHPDFVNNRLDQPFELGVVEEVYHLSVRGFIDPEHITEKASILNNLEDEGFGVVDVQLVTFDIFGTLTVLFTYIAQFIFSSIVSIS
ncbi:MAG: ATP-binding cassette domain-containing protein, partial [Candidatus Izemoplasmataceae bacterium]